MNRRTAALAAIGIAAWASILVSQVGAVAAPGDRGNASDNAQIEPESGYSIGPWGDQP